MRQYPHRNLTKTNIVTLTFDCKHVNFMIFHDGETRDRLLEGPSGSSALQTRIRKMWRHA